MRNLQDLKIICFGDIHGRDVWKDIIKVEGDADHYVFLGDYVTSRENISEEDQIKNLKELFDWADEMNKYTPGRVVLLRGNHDMEALGYSWAECYPMFYNTYLEENCDWFLEHTQWLVQINNVVFSHAGITQRWYEDMKKKYPEITCFEDINKIEPNSMFGFRTFKFSDYYGDTPTQPLTWVRPGCLCEYGFPDITYVVGHTTQASISNYKHDLIEKHDLGEYAKCDIWVCDTLPREYLLIDKGEFIPIKMQSVNFE